MKKALLLAPFFLLPAGAFAHADAIRIERHPYAYDFDRADYHFDSRTGKAWLDIRLTEYLDDSADYPQPGPRVRHYTERTDVAGLSFDAAASGIFFSAATRDVQCAVVTHPRGAVGRKSPITPTGLCRTFVREEDGAESVYFEAK